MVVFGGGIFWISFVCAFCCGIEIHWISRNSLSRTLIFCFKSMVSSSSSDWSASASWTKRKFRSNEVQLQHRMNKKESTYCWWLKSCTSWYGKYPIIYRVSYIPGGAGFQPSTLVPKTSTWKWLFQLDVIFQSLHPRVQHPRLKKGPKCWCAFLQGWLRLKIWAIFGINSLDFLACKLKILKNWVFHTQNFHPFFGNTGGGPLRLLESKKQTTLETSLLGNGSLRYPPKWRFVKSTPECFVIKKSWTSCFWCNWVGLVIPNTYTEDLKKRLKKNRRLFSFAKKPYLSRTCMTRSRDRACATCRAFAATLRNSSASFATNLKKPTI